MVDPLAEVVTLLQPGASFSKIVSGAGPWRVRRSEAGRPFYCVILDGSCRLAVDGHEPITLQAGDFVLIPSAYGFTMSSLEPATRRTPRPRPSRCPMANSDSASKAARLTFECWSATASLVRRTRPCWFRSSRNSCTFAASKQAGHPRAARGRRISRAAARA